nr:FeoA family protein [Desulfurispora thermophila]
MFSLPELAPGQSGVVRRIILPTDMYNTLLSLGILPGTIVRVVRRSPLGDPTAYFIRGAMIALRRKTASGILVQRVDA